ncbi:peptide deformylase [Neoehrlichia mikurensis]|uniref:Peptide deformylase n=1 Tax=Neoehrlichia mikurensis TaxID=89586 RepID=A0A9Q9BTF4_9RICK|nr:peptide deformylase [Neoehrlichia mikurensis]QXK92287.1 peptide deformylase [Neoehrlichia mikurensis]UTO55855.1 peptide deformylase [Neoehrlichia mikurensis]
MSILPIITVPDKRLFLCSEVVTEINSEIKKLVDDMFETMYFAKGFGLAAVQVGVHKRVFVADIPQQYNIIENSIDGYDSVGGPFCIINPQILEVSKEMISMQEGCLSVPEQSEEVTRPQCIVVKYMDYNGREKIIKAQGWLARCFEHEIDHLNGIVFFRYLSKIKRDFLIKKVKKIKKF